MYKSLVEILAEKPGFLHLKTKFQTGFSALDQILQGFNPSDLVLIAAKPGNCGNIFMKNIGVQMGKRYHVLFINTEKDPYTYAKEIETIASSAPSNSRMMEINRPHSILNIESEARFMEEIDETIGQFRRDYPEEAVVLVDNMNDIFYSKGSGEYSFEKQAFEISGNMKMLTLKHHIPILMYHRTKIKELADIFKPAAPVDFDYLEDSNHRFDKILSVYRPEYYRIDIDENGLSTRNKLYIHVLRNNTGDRGTSILDISEENRLLLADNH